MDQRALIVVCTSHGSSCWRVNVDALICSNRLKVPIATVVRPASVQAKGEPAESVPATIQMPQAVIPTEIRYATAVSVTVSRLWARRLLMSAIEDRETQATPAHGMRFQFAALSGAIGHAEPRAACRELPCVAVPLVRTGCDQSDIFD